MGAAGAWLHCPPGRTFFGPLTRARDCAGHHWGTPCPDGSIITCRGTTLWIGTVRTAGWPIADREEDVIAVAQQQVAQQRASWAYAEQFCPEDDVLAAARAKGAELGRESIQPGGGATLRLLAAALDARAVVEVGTGTGVSGLWLLRGMRSDGVLTTVEVQPDTQRVARDTFAAAGIASNRVRLINGRALEVLPRLTDGVYDLVFVDADQHELPTYLDEALRLLRPGGLVAFNNALGKDRVADPAQRDPETVAVREFGRQVRTDERLLACLLPVGGGLLCAVKRAAEAPVPRPGL